MLVGGIITVVSVIIVVVCWRIYVRRNERKARCSSTINGVVTRLIESQNSEGRPSWKPVFTYTVGRDEYTIVSSVASTPPQYKVGEWVVVKYDPFNPSDGFVEGERGPKIMLIIFTVVGVFDLVVGLVLFILAAVGVLS
ncbi:hypothetical protein BMYO_2013 [Bifidobacterium myosotis]|uniref:DUF3592 domain-containing protein n=2 Tax=Bifidobacterium myosotis TaxID=1630166 RepID=A0A261FDN0_9BIFI|nr:hypothetical protein BMYO_2013 [Bifidobacterium myosotis]